MAFKLCNLCSRASRLWQMFHENQIGLHIGSLSFFLIYISDLFEILFYKKPLENTYFENKPFFQRQYHQRCGPT